MERKLASIQLIDDIQPIDGADMIELASVLGWKVVVQKGLYKAGDTAIYCEVDSFLPIKPEFEFLRKSSLKWMGDQLGFRLKTIKLKGQISQGLLLPISMLPADITLAFDEWYTIGDDVTGLLEIVKYEPTIPANLTGRIRGNLPNFIPKTNEDRIQNLKKYYEEMKGSLYYDTEKLEGSSATFYISASFFGVASRNWDLEESEGNTFWKVANELKLQDRLGSLSSSIALQGEMIGEGIQGNIYKLKGHTVKFYNAWDIHNQRYLDITEFKTVITQLGLDTVPIISTEYRLPESIDELIASADGKSQLNPQTDREGLVIRSHDRKTSFKVISNFFLLKDKN